MLLAGGEHDGRRGIDVQRARRLHHRRSVLATHDDGRLARMQRRGGREQRKQSLFLFFGLRLLEQLGAGVLHDVGDVRRPRHQEEREMCGGRTFDEFLRDVAFAQVLADVENQRGGASAQEGREKVLEPVLAQRREPRRDDELAAAQK